MDNTAAKKNMNTSHNNESMNLFRTYFDLSSPLRVLIGAVRWMSASAMVDVLANSSSNCFLGKPVNYTALIFSPFSQQ